MIWAATTVAYLLGMFVSGWLHRRELGRRLDRIEVRLIHLTRPWKD